jgi:UDP-3-O-[3-hydroxymyristoyl] N-acetylglucosamine deacetylase
VGHPLVCSYEAHKSGHAMNNLLLRELLKHPDSYEIVSYDSVGKAPPSYARQMEQEWSYN